MLYVELIFLYTFQLHGNRMLARFHVVDVAGSMRGEVGMTILHRRELVLPALVSRSAMEQSPNS